MTLEYERRPQRPLPKRPSLGHLFAQIAFLALAWLGSRYWEKTASYSTVAGLLLATLGFAAVMSWLQQFLRYEAAQSRESRFDR
jgi:hypothetical protein